MLKNLKIAAIAATCLATASVAHATDITRTYDITGSDFTYSEGPDPSASSPVSSFEGFFTITFDPTVDTVDSTTSLVVNSLSFPSTTAYSYTPTYDYLSIATDPEDNTVIGFPPNSYGISIAGPTTVSSGPYNTVYFDSSANNLYYSEITTTTVSADSVSATPEPSNWVLMIAGVGLIGAALRFGVRRDRAVAAA